MNKADGIEYLLGSYVRRARQAWHRWIEYRSRPGLEEFARWEKGVSAGFMLAARSAKRELEYAELNR